MSNRLKKRHFDQKIEITQKKIWDVEFLRHRLRIDREDSRRQYDQIKEKLETANARLEEEKKKTDPDKTIMDNLQHVLDRYSPDLEQLTEKMKQIDAQLDGEGGATATLDGYHALAEMLKEYRRGF